MKSALVWLGSYVIGPARGRPLLLGAGLVAVVLLAFELIEEPEDGFPSVLAQALYQELLDQALRSDGAARAALKETAHYLGIGIANLIRGLAPEAVIVGGPIVRAWPIISQEISNTVEATMCRGLPSTRIIDSTLGPEPTLMGALSLVLASKFASVSVT